MSLIVKAADQGINGLGIATNTVGVKQGGGKGKPIFAGTLLVPSETDNLVEQKRKEAQKQAKKIVGDAWQKDQKALQKIDDKWKLWNDKFTQIKDSEGRIADIEEAKERLQQEYDVDPESQEQMTGNIGKISELFKRLRRSKIYRRRTETFGRTPVYGADRISDRGVKAKW